ncbi:MAG: hypothetical protein PHD40_05635 [Syntrophomonadaceae bacterium]|nr:hypothetical protein [Syntrophomonadaceae bacterium]
MKSDKFVSMLKQAKAQKQAKVLQYENYLQSTANEELRKVYQQMLLKHRNNMMVLHQIEEAVLNGDEISGDIFNLK